MEALADLAAAAGPPNQAASDGGATKRPRAEASIRRKILFEHGIDGHPMLEVAKYIPTQVL
jgi:hypothetical protein